MVGVDWWECCGGVCFQFVVFWLLVRCLGVLCCLVWRLRSFAWLRACLSLMLQIASHSSLMAV